MGPQVQSQRNQYIDLPCCILLYILFILRLEIFLRSDHRGTNTQTSPQDLTMREPINRSTMLYYFSQIVFVAGGERSLRTSGPTIDDQIHRFTMLYTQIGYIAPKEIHWDLRFGHRENTLQIYNVMFLQINWSYCSDTSGLTIS